MESRMPNGALLREFFDSEVAMEKRRKEIEAFGGTVERVVRVHESKYKPHQGKREMDRRKKVRG